MSLFCSKVFKARERQLFEKKAKISAEKAIDIAKTIYTIKVKVIGSKRVIEKIIITTDQQQYLTDLFQFY